MKTTQRVRQFVEKYSQIINVAYKMYVAIVLPY